MSAGRSQVLVWWGRSTDILNGYLKLCTFHFICGSTPLRFLQTLTFMLRNINVWENFIAFMK